MRNDHTEDPKRMTVHVDVELEHMMPGFLERRRDDLESIREALDWADFQAIQFLAHRMTGSGAGYGFDRISDIGTLLGQAARDEAAEEVRRLAGELVDYLNNVDIVHW